MSALRNIVIAMVAFQLGLMVINNVEIAPGISMATGNITNGQANIDPKPLIDGLGDIKDLLANAGTANRTQEICLPPIGGVVPVVFDWLGIKLCHTVSSNPNIVEQLALIVQSLIVIGVTMAIMLFSLIYNSTVGAIFLYINLFSLIDPTLGAILGTAVGTIQTVLVVWYTSMLIISIWGGGGEKT
jgi:hypothetical protein